LGSTSYLTNKMGVVSQHVEYIPFGETLIESHLNNQNNPYLYNGKELDAETGFYYYGARYYDPKSSLWLSVDPLAGYNPIFEDEHYIDGQHNGGIFNAGNLNVYGYTYQNPIRYIDPNGKQVDAVDFIPIAGSTRDIYRGARDGDWLTLGIGVVGLAVDIATLGSGSVVKGGIKAGVKTVAKEVTEQGAKQVVKKTVTKAEQIAINNSVGKLAEVTVTKGLAKKYAGSTIGSQITARFADGTAVVFDNVVVKGGKIQLINETKTGAAKLSTQQARFFNGGEAVTFVGDKAKKIGLLGETTSKSKVATTITRASE